MEKLYFLSFSHVFQESLIDNTQIHAVDLLLTWLTQYPDILNRHGQPYTVNGDLVGDLEKGKQDVPKPMKIAVSKNPQIAADALVQFSEFLSSEISPQKENDLYFRLWKLIDATEIAPATVKKWLSEYNSHEYAKFLADVFLYAIVQDAPTHRGKKTGLSEKDTVIRDIDRLNSLLKGLADLPPIPKPEEIASVEDPFMEELLLAYGDHLKAEYHQKCELPEDLQEDLEYRRDDFYSAETVLIQGASALGIGDDSEFCKLKEEVFSNVRDTYTAARTEDGYHRMLKVMERSDLTPCVKCVLARTNWVGSAEKRGICHMLAGEKKLRWVNPDD